MTRTLLGRWVLDPDDREAFERFGPMAATFTAGGDLVFSDRRDGLLGRIVLTYRVEQGLLITDQPSHPGETRNPFELTADGKLRLQELGMSTTFVREVAEDPFDADASLFALAGHALRHGVLSAGEGDAFYAFLMSELASGARTLSRFVAETADQSREGAVREAALASSDVVACAYVYDGYLTADDERTDAVFAELSRRGRPTTLLVAQRYAFEQGEARPARAMRLVSSAENDSWLRDPILL